MNKYRISKQVKLLVRHGVPLPKIARILSIPESEIENLNSLLIPIIEDHNTIIEVTKIAKMPITISQQNEYDAIQAMVNADIYLPKAFRSKPQKRNIVNNPNKYERF